MKEQRRLDLEKFCKCIKATVLLESREKEQKCQAKLKREEARRVKSKQMIYAIMEEEEMKNCSLTLDDANQLTPSVVPVSSSRTPPKTL